MKIIIEGDKRVVNSLFKQAKNSKKLIVSIVEEEAVAKEKEEDTKKVTVEEMKTFLTEKGVKFHARLGKAKLTILYNENK